MTITMYRGNRVDQAEQLEPDELAAEFVATLTGQANPDYKRSGRINLDFEYRWWLSSPIGKALSWEEKDWPALWQALSYLLDGLDDPAYDAVIQSLGREE